MPKITPFLWFDGRAEEAMDFYCSVFPNSKIGMVSRMNGQVMTANFELDGQVFTALNGGPMYKFSEAISLYVHCKDQDEVDHFWTRLGTEGGGEPGRCGWVKDRFGVSWQIIPDALPQLMSDPDPAKAGRVAQAMMKMDKIDVAALKAAHAA